MEQNNKKKNFYEILGIGRQATAEEIRKSYHCLARRYHPDKNKHPDAEQIFKQVVKAYTVLSDPKMRAAYDLTLLTEEIHDPRKERRPQDPDVTQDLSLTLEEINTGCIKHWTFNRTEILPDGSLTTKERTLHINIWPGCPSNKKIIFYKEGSQTHNRTPANIVFTIREQQHPQFDREGPNLIYEVVISLKQALCGAHLQIPTLDRVTYYLCTFGSVIAPGSTREINGLGLPYPSSDRRGNLVVCFVISFPDSLDGEAVSALEKILPS